MAILIVILALLALLCFLFAAFRVRLNPPERTPEWFPLAWAFAFSAWAFLANVFHF